VENYFNYFTEIEEHFLRRRGGGLLLSTLDWALIETWKDAGIPLEAVLRGIDTTFDRWDEKPSKTRKVNGLGFCSQEVLAAAEEMKEAAVGAASSEERKAKADAGFAAADICSFLRRNADELEAAKLPEGAGVACKPLAVETARWLREMAGRVESEAKLPKLEELERRLTVAEDKLFAILLAASPDDQIVGVRADADRELAAYRGKMQAAQIEQLMKQYLHTRLLDQYGLPRLSLFYM
jgi:hypothetical protein